MLFAETPDWQVAVMVLGPFVGGAVQWAAASALKLRTQSRADRLQDDETAIQRLESLLKRVDAERVEQREEARKLAEALRKSERAWDRAVVWIKHLESALDAAKVPYQRWEDVEETLTDGSGPHTPLSDRTPPPG